MKINRIAVLLSVLAFAITSQPFKAEAVVNWTKHATNPVLTRGSSPAWDEGALQRPAVIKDGETYKMWYTGIDGSAVLRMGYATSSDGTSWTKSPSNPVLEPSLSGWDSQGVGYAWILKDGSTYKMWYSGASTSDPQIGYTTSSDGTSWTNAPSPLALNGGTSDWDAGVFGPCVIKDDDAPGSERYKMWYVGYNFLAHRPSIGYATSPDGINWTKYDNPSTTADPHANSDHVVRPGSEFWPGIDDGSWDVYELGPVTVIKEDSTYRMWYYGKKDDMSPGWIGYAYSLDGINWKKYDGNPVVMEGDTAQDDFDEEGPYDPMVLKDGNTYKMWYVGSKDCVPPCIDEIGYATSPAYHGTHLAINRMMVHTINTPGGERLVVGVRAEGPGPLDISELKVTGPGGFSYTFNDYDILNNMGNQFSAMSFPIPALVDGVYAFSVKANNGLTAQNTLTLTASTKAVPEDGPDNLDRAVFDDQASWNTSTPVYVGTSAPSFRWRPYLGDDFYYRVRVQSWNHESAWYFSSPALGSTKQPDGYMYVDVPADILKPNTPYHWRIEVGDTDNLWSAWNRAVGDWYQIYTGTKSGAGDFLDSVNIFATRSFIMGDTTRLTAGVVNLAPWDIDTTTDPFRVENEDDTDFYYFNPGPYGDAFTTDPHPFSYGCWQPFIILDAVTDGYEFHVSDGTDSESMFKLFSDVSPLPQVNRKEMTPVDNAYLSSTTPTLAWKSKGPEYKYQVTVHDWNRRRITYSSEHIEGVTAGQDMSVTIPDGTLRAYSPYHWWVSVYDASGNSRTWSQWLSFMTGGIGIRGQVTGGEGEGGTVYVLAFSDFLTLPPVAETVADSNGNYLLSGLPDGNYYIFAFRDVNDDGPSYGEYQGTYQETPGPPTQVPFSGTDVENIDITLIDTTGAGPNISQVEVTRVQLPSGTGPTGAGGLHGIFELKLAEGSALPNLIKVEFPGDSAFLDFTSLEPDEEGFYVHLEALSSIPQGEYDFIVMSDNYMFDIREKLLTTDQSAIPPPPIPDQPPDGAMVQTSDTLSFSWTIDPALDGNLQQLSIASNTPMTEEVFVSDEITESGYDLTSGDVILTEGTTYYWFAGVADDSGENWAYGSVGSFTVDNTPPTVAIDPVTTPTSVSSQTVTGTREAGATITATTDTDAQVGTVSYPGDTTWSFDVTGLVSGANVITVTATDSAGNTQNAEATITFYEEVSVVVPPGYDPDDPATWPMVVSGDSYDFAVSGGEGSAYTWTVSGPVSVPGGTGEEFPFEAPTAGPFAGVYTVTVTDDATGWSYSSNVRVPMSITPRKKAMLGDPGRAYDFVVAGAAEGTELEVTLATRDKAPIADPADYGAITSDPTFGFEGTADMALEPADVTGEYKSFLFRAKAIEGDGTPLMANGLDVLYSGVMRIFPVDAFTGRVEDVNGAVQGAEVMISLGSELIAETATAADGTFSFEVADPSFIGQHYAVVVTKSGYVTRFLTTQGWANSQVITLALADPELSVSGTVTELVGATPIPGARVECTADGQAALAFSDSNGDYTLNLPAGGTWNYNLTNGIVDPNPWDCPPMVDAGTATLTQVGNEVTLVTTSSIDQAVDTFRGFFEGAEYVFSGSRRERGGTATIDITISLSSPTSGSGTLEWHWIHDNGMAECTGRSDLTITRVVIEMLARASKVGFRAAKQDIYADPDFELEAQTGDPQQEVCEDGASFQWQSCTVDIPADALDACYDMTVDPNIPVEDESLYTENSVVLVQIDIPGAPLPLDPPIQVTIPFDSDDVEPGDFKAGIAVIYHAATADDLRSGTNVAAVPRSDIVYEDHLNAMVSFLVRDHLSVFGAGGAQAVGPSPTPIAAAGGGGGG